MLASIMIVHRSRIDRLDVPARSIFRSRAIFKREALLVTTIDGDLVIQCTRLDGGSGEPLTEN